MLINNVFDFNKALEDDVYAWPGGYPRFFITSDGAALSFESVQENADIIRDSIIRGDTDGWRVVAVEINWEDGDLICDHSGKRIESAYSDDSE